MTDKPRPLPVAQMVADAGRVLEAVEAGDHIPDALVGDLACHVLALADALDRAGSPGKAGDAPGGAQPRSGADPRPKTDASGLKRQAGRWGRDGRERTMIERIITGGQQGADLGAWRAAKAVQIPTGGYMPTGFLTEQGPRPEFEPLFGAKALEYGGYRERTRANVQAADAVLVFCAGTPGYRSPGTQLALRLCIEMERPCRFVDIDRLPPTPEATADWLRADPGIRTLCVGGNRESRAPGIGERVEQYLIEIFRLLREGQGP